MVEFTLTEKGNKDPIKVNVGEKAPHEMLPYSACKLDKSFLSGSICSSAELTSVKDALILLRNCFNLTSNTPLTYRESLKGNLELLLKPLIINTHQRNKAIEKILELYKYGRFN